MNLLLDNTSIQMGNSTTISELMKKLNVDDILWQGQYLSQYKQKMVFDTILEYSDLSLPFYQIYEKYFNKPNIQVDYDKIKLFNNLEIQFHKTIKVPSDGKEHLLPPSTGVYKIDSHDKELYLRMKPEEAMWVSFSNKKHVERVAVKVATGTLDAISGTLFTNDLSSEPQNYLSVPTQPWIDGVYAGNGVVRQFVVLNADNKETIDNKLKDRFIISEANNTIRFHIHRKLDIYNDMNIYVPDTKTFMSITDIPSNLQVESKIIFIRKSDTSHDLLLRDIGVQDGDKIHGVKYDKDNLFLFIKTLSSRKFNIVINTNATVSDLKEAIQLVDGIPSWQQRLIFGGKALYNDHKLEYYDVNNGDTIHLVLALRGGGCGEYERAGISCGGLIKQKIYKDNFIRSIEDYSTTYTEIIINLISDTDSYQAMSHKEYIEKKLPWYQLSDSNQESIASHPNNLLHEI